MTRVVDTAGLNEIVQLLRAEGRTVIAPTVRDGTIVPDQIDSADELPVGQSLPEHQSVSKIKQIDQKGPPHETQNHSS